jgi:hypothetical protein
MLCPITPPPPPSENRAVQKIMWKNTYRETGHKLHYNTALEHCMMEN